MINLPPSHCPLTYFKVEQGQLVVGNIPLARLVQRVGQTPFYAYDRVLIDQRVQTLQAQLPAELQLHFAMKANPMPAVVQQMARLVDGIDVASAGEMRVALDTGIAAERISFAGPGKGQQALQQAIAAQVLINVESRQEFQSIVALCAQLGLNAKVAVRVNPDFELKSAGMKMGGSAKPFGVDVTQVPALLREIEAAGLDLQGFHIYSGSQNLNADAIIDAQAKSLQLAIQLSDLVTRPINMINIGGGLGIPYFPGEQPLKIAPIGLALEASMAEFNQQLPSTKVVMELGRYLVGEAGVYITQIIDKKISQGQVFLITDGGLHHHLAASGNFGQVLRKNYPVAIGNKMASFANECVSIVGPLCTPLDILADKVMLPTAEIGDLVVVFQSGAYGYTASPQLFLSHPPAVEVLV